MCLQKERFMVTAARKQKVELDAQQATVTRLKEEESLLAKKEELLRCYRM